MSNGILNLQMIGRFGNQALQYLHARALAERDGLELRTPRWIGEKIFQIEPTVEPDYSGDYLHGYFQNQESAIYTLRQVREWFKFQDWVVDLFKHVQRHENVAHIRRGDMAGYGYPLIALQSYYNACHKFKVDGELCVVCEEVPGFVGGLTRGVEWLPDFVTLISAKTLLRANSTFSFVAGMLNQNRVLSPAIDGLEGGKEHLCEFVEGNHSRLANLEGITEMRISP